VFGLTFEKLLLVGFLAAVILGPRRLPVVVAEIAAFLRGVRRTADAARVRAVAELGVPAGAVPWRALDPRQYDPRRIIAEALAAPTVPGAQPSAPVVSAPSPSDDDPADPAASTLAVSDPAGFGEPRDGGRARHPVTPSRAAAARRIRVGTSAHPRWVVVPAEGDGTDGSGDGSAASDGVASPAGPDGSALDGAGDDSSRRA
jgi:sec-independent protein translocase protein TatB